MARSFDLPSEPTANNNAVTILGFDVPLLAITLSTLFSIVKRTEVVKTLTEKCLFEVLYECLYRICDDRLLHPSQAVSDSPESMETAQQIVRALNMIILKLSSEANTSTVLHVLLQVIFLCIPTNEVTHEKGKKCL